jgi:hypothetical protein
MASRELFTLAMTSEVRLWSITKAIESGSRIDREDPDRLARVVLVDLEIAPGEAGDQLSLGVLDGDRNLDVGGIQDDSGSGIGGVQELGRGGLEVVFAFCQGRLAAGCCRLGLALPEDEWAIWLVSGADSRE